MQVILNIFLMNELRPDWKIGPLQAWAHAGNSLVVFMFTDYGRVRVICHCQFFLDMTETVG